LNFALALFLFSTVSMTKLRLTTKSTPTAPTTVTFQGHIQYAGSAQLIPENLLATAKVVFKSDDGKSYNAKIVGEGMYQVTLPIGSYTREVTVAGFKTSTAKVCVRTSAGDSILPKHTVSLEAIPVPPKKPEIPIEPNPIITLRGYIKDATTNKPINSTNISLTFTNNSTKTVYKATVFPGGLYEVTGFKAGSYKVEALLKGYTDEVDTRNITGSSDEKDLRNVILMSPEVNGWRAVLTWGSTPLDLDAHVQLPDGKEVNFDTRKSGDGKVTLDVDARKGFGPETVTWIDPSPGVYKYYVNRYTNEASIQVSKAKVVVYRGNKKILNLKVPTTGDATLDNWYVFDLDTEKGEIVTMNQLISSG